MEGAGDVALGGSLHLFPSHGVLFAFLLAAAAADAAAHVLHAALWGAARRTGLPGPRQGAHHGAPAFGDPRGGRDREVKREDKWRSKRMIQYNRSDLVNKVNIN